MGKVDRKEFFRTAGRLVMLGGFVSAGIYISTSGRMKGAENCTGDGYCSSCGLLSGCKLPKADKYRNHGQG